MTDNSTAVPTSGLTPHIQVGDKKASEAIAFYIAAFGATEIMRMPAEDGIRLMHAHVHINGASLMLHDEFPEYVSPEEANMAGGSGMTLHLQVDDADAWFGRAVAAGATPVMPPEDTFWGDRYGQVKDPFGYRWSMGHPLNKDA